MLTVELGDCTTHLTRGKLPVVLDHCDSSLEVQKLLVPLQSHTRPVPSAEEKQMPRLQSYQVSGYALRLLSKWCCRKPKASTNGLVPTSGTQHICYSRVILLSSLQSKRRNARKRLEWTTTASRCILLPHSRSSQARNDPFTFSLMASYKGQECAPKLLTYNQTLFCKF